MQLPTVYGICGARRKDDGRPCQRLAMRNGRCRLHGGLATGPRTDEGRYRISQAQRKRWAAWRAARTAKEAAAVSAPVDAGTVSHEISPAL